MKLFLGLKRQYIVEYGQNNLCCYSNYIEMAKSSFDSEMFSRYNRILIMDSPHLVTHLSYFSFPLLFKPAKVVNVRLGSKDIFFYHSCN